MLKNQRRERFAQLVASGMTATAAYAEAGYRSSHSNHSNGPTLARNEEIRARVAQINAARWAQERAAAAVAVERTAITREALIAKAEEVRAKAMEAGQFSAAVAAIRELGVLTGLRIERSERGAPHEFSELSDADLLKELREMGYRIEVDAPPTHGMN